MADEPVIEIRGLQTQFGHFVVHKELDMTINQGEIVALVGGSGEGKTTLIRQILGLTKPAKGTIRVFGQDIHQMNAAQSQSMHSRWGMLFQHGALFSAMTVFDNVAQPMRELRYVPEKLVRDAVLLKLHMVGISPDDALKMPADLSGGMIKRVALARALALEPELLFLDEPTAGLDPSLSDSFVELIKSLHETLHLTMLIVTHDLDTIFELATQIAVLADKRVLVHGKPQQVLALEHPFVQEFFHGPRGKRAQQCLSS